MIPNIPQLVTQRWLDDHRSEDETHEAHILLKRVSHPGAYTLRGSARKYLVERDPRRCAHVLRVPLSLWMFQYPEGPWRHNPSICSDLLSNRSQLKSPLEFTFYPIDGVPTWKADQLDLLEVLVTRLAFEQDPKRMDALMTDEIKARLEVVVSEKVDAILRDHGREDMLSFINSFWSADYGPADEPEPEAVADPEPVGESPEEEKKRKNRERQKAYRERKKQEALASK